MKKLTASLQWLDANILKVLLIGFIYIIPLYPKLPLNFIEYTFIYIRAEDYYIALVCLVFFIQLIRRKVTFPRQMIIPIFLFWTAVVSSYVVANFVLHSLP